MITITQKGSFDKTERYLRQLKFERLLAVLDKYGSRGVEALAAATPVDSGETANSWYYTTEQRKGYYSIIGGTTDMNDRWFSSSGHVAVWPRHWDWRICTRA
jgi:hypothetical protein